MLKVLSLIKNKAGDRPRPTRENGPDPNLLLFFQVKFLLNPLKLHLNDSGFSIGLEMFIVDEVASSI